MHFVPSAVDMFMGVLMVFASGGGLGSLPLAMPPGEPDPVMSHVAPEDCLVYLSWSGTDKASADSENRTEQLLADPEVRHLIEGLEERLLQAIDDGAGQTERGRAIAETLPVLLKTIATRPTAFFAGRVTFDPRGLGTPVGLVVNVSGQEEDIETALATLQEQLNPLAESEIVELNDQQWRVWPTPIGAPPVVWAVLDEYLVVAVGPGTPLRIMNRLEKAQTPEWLASVQKRLSVERQAMISHINLSGIVDNATQFIGPMAPQVHDVMKRLGVDNAESLTTVTGLEGNGCVTRTWLQVDGKLTGVLAPLGAEPLSADDLSPIPADASIAMAARLDAGAVFEQFTQLVAQFDARSIESLKSELDQFDEEVGFDLREAFSAIGDVWCVYQSPSEGGSLMTGWTAVASLRDPDKARKIAGIIATNAREIERELVEQLGRRGVRSLSVADYEFGGHTVYFLNAIGESVPVAPAWCITDDKLVISLFPQGVNAYLRRTGGGSIADNPAVVASMKRDGQPLMLGYYDSKRMLRLVWPPLQMLANVAFAELQQQGLNVDISLLPSLASLEQYVSGATITVVPTDDGVELVSRRVLPVGPEVGLAAALPLVGWTMSRPFTSQTLGNPAALVGSTSLLDALSPVRARRVQSTHKLKQIGLALHNHHDTFRKFPDEAIRGDREKPLLSWRVKLLPFVGERALFDRFRMNESWDSPHNRSLIEEMPSVFKVPGLDLEAGQTTYVGIVGAGTMFDPGRDGMAMHEITDGTSNTLMVAEAAPESAVIWTKPDDLTLNEDDARIGLHGARRGGFLGLLADGSVQFLSEQLPSETVRQMSIRNDGVAVNFRRVQSAQRPDVLPAPPRSQPRPAGSSEAPAESPFR